MPLRQLRALSRGKALLAACLLALTASAQADPVIVPPEELILRPGDTCVFKVAEGEGAQDLEWSIAESEGGTITVGKDGHGHYQAPWVMEKRTFTVLAKVPGSLAAPAECQVVVHPHAVLAVLDKVLEPSWRGPRLESFSGSPYQRGHRDGSGFEARFQTPLALAPLVYPFDPSLDNRLIVADPGRNNLRLVDSDGAATTWVGHGATGDHAKAQLRRPEYLTVMPGTVRDPKSWKCLASDHQSNVIRGLDAQGRVTIFAGAPSEGGHHDGPKAKARFNQPKGLALDMYGNVYVADSGNSCIRRILASGNVETLCTGVFESTIPGWAKSVSPFEDLKGMAVDPQTNLIYVVDGNCIRVMGPSGGAATFLGSAKRPGFEGWRSEPWTGAGERPLKHVPCLNNPTGIAIYSQQLYIADTGNHAIRMFDFKTQRLVTLVGHPDAGETNFGSIALNNPGADPETLASLESPTAIAFGSGGRCWITTKAGIVLLLLDRGRREAAPAAEATQPARVGLEECKAEAR